MFVFVGFICTDCLEFCEPLFSNFFLRLTFLVSCPWLYYFFSFSVFLCCTLSLFTFTLFNFLPNFLWLWQPLNNNLSLFITYSSNVCRQQLFTFTAVAKLWFQHPFAASLSHAMRLPPPHPPPLWSVSSEVRRRRPLLKWKRGSRVDSVTFGTLSWKNRAKRRGKENEMTGLTSLYVT